MKRRITSWPVIAVLVAATLVAGWTWRGSDDLFELRRNFEIFGAVYEELVTSYVDDIRPQPFMKAGIDAMLAELDPYTVFYDEADLVEMSALQNPAAGTAGLNLGERGGQIRVLPPDSHAEAYRSGIQTGDILLEIDGVDAAGLSLTEAYTLLQGEPGSVVQVLVQRSTDTPSRMFTLRRVRTQTENVAWAGWVGDDPSERIAYVRLDQFGERAGRETRRALRNLADGEPLGGVVLDLRNNPGGIVTEAVDVVELFVPDETSVVRIATRDGASDQTYRTDMDALFPEAEVIVLVNRFSASASEIVAGALQDLEAARVMGETTFGKGLVQVVRRLPHDTALKMTIAHYTLPSGRIVPTGEGIEPDIHVDVPAQSDLEVALRADAAFFLFSNAWVNGACGGSVSLPTVDACLADEAAVLSAFERFLVEQGFSYTTPMESDAEVLLAELEEASWTEALGQLASLRDVMAQEKRQDLERYAPSLLAAIESSVAAHLLEGEARTAREVAHDPLVARAVETLQNSPRRSR